tara:strand:+ start:7579 stop:8904 length:1326 start_codon:yes stop_codon:yes gene_type:complete
MKIHVKTTYLLVVLALTISYSAMSAPADACLGFYDKTYLQVLPTKTQRLRRDAWSLPKFFSDRSEIAVPSRWKTMIENNDSVPYQYTEKTFERKTIDGTKYTTSYHVLQPTNGKYKTTIVLQHGFAESAIYFASMTRLLVAMGFRVVAMDGANAGHTLMHTLKNRGRALKAPSPVEDGLALAEVLRLEIPKGEKFILLGHSRGFAVSSLALATGQFDKQLIKHISSNGYDTWKVDEIVDKQIYNPFFFIPGLGQFTEYFANQMRNILRRQTNKISDPILLNSVTNHQAAKSKQEVGIELSEEVTRMFLSLATIQIADGLKGSDTSQHGYDNTSLYNRDMALRDYDNGFGLVNPKARYQISHLSDEVKNKTMMVFGDSDKLINKAGSKTIVDEVGGPIIEFSTDKETGVEAGHFLPSERPFDLVETILNVFKEERAKSRTAP